MARLLRQALGGAAVACLGLGCSGKDPYNPGTPLGTFRVSAKLVETTCGPVPDPWQFDVRLSHDETSIYWVQGGAPVAGRVDAQKRVVLRARDEHMLRPADARGRTPACVVAREDVLDVVLATSAAAPVADVTETATLLGSLSYSFTPSSGSDCADQLEATGGGFAALPCLVRYEIAAQRVAEPEALR